MQIQSASDLCVEKETLPQFSGGGGGVGYLSVCRNIEALFMNMFVD